MISYQDTLDGIVPDQLNGFFVGWSNQPSPVTHYRLLCGSRYIALMLDNQTGQVVGFGWECCALMAWC